MVSMELFLLSLLRLTTTQILRADYTEPQVSMVTVRVSLQHLPGVSTGDCRACERDIYYARSSHVVPEEGRCVASVQYLQP
uniref:Putative secreted protein n=1 Tax=Anopheles marajoara TaxID=58244 RepID=A0A2M4CBH5_9DIPT